MKKKVFDQIWQATKKIPQGKVTTYGQIAKLLGLRDARVVGWALHANRDPEVPCHRVVNRHGGLAMGYAFGGWRGQKKKLLEERVRFVSLKKVDLKQNFGKKIGC